LLAEKRRQTVNHRTDLVNQLTSVLKTYYPQAFTLIGTELFSPLGCAWLLKWPSLAAAQQATDKAITAFYRHHHVYDPEKIAQRCQTLRAAKPLTTDAVILATAPLEVNMLVNMIVVLNQTIAHYEETLATLYPSHPDAAIFSSLPGAGPALAPRLLGAFGTDRHRYPQADDLQSFSGIAPILIASGRTQVVAARYFCPTFLHQTFFEFAKASIPHSLWANAYYLQNSGHSMFRDFYGK
jgi:hypothetical protein